MKEITELFETLAVVGYLLASLPESFNMLVMALETSSENVPIVIVTERLLHEERKSKEKGAGDDHSGR